ncbi:OsmC family protein [Dyadobacter sp. CY343]|uniref:OsmC family protein n=1 Tax=Dyadobacter sp. CY343 TaxID=2907299 RepID=UPI001F1FDA42|nr:OsmC family protein [Dyadobacter sp. CY343]MCE7060887.1 OsmC family protein [Dyadobacter sp. CY343]
MKISARIQSEFNQHSVLLETNGSAKSIQIAPKPTGYGSSVNGGELLLLALATCFCNDIYREAAKMNIIVTGVEVDCTAEFGADGQPGDNFQYAAKVTSDASKAAIDDLIRHTNEVAEIHNTLRKGAKVTLVQ